jgi:hypothetical protein
VQVISNKRSTERTERRSSYGLVRSLPVEGDAATAAALSVVREHFTGRPATVARILDTGHSEVYNRLMLLGEKPMPLHLFVRLLLALPTEKARQAVQEIGSHLELDVTPRAAVQTKAAELEAIDVAAAFGHVMDRFRAVVADRRVTDEEIAAVESAAAETKKEIDELLQAVRVMR